MKKSFRLLVVAATLAMSSPLAVLAAADTTPPVVGGISPTSATQNAPVNLSANYSDSESGVARCFFMEGSIAIYDSQAHSPTVGGTASVTHTFTTVGNHYLQAKCLDAANNWGYGPMTTVWVVASPGSDTTPPNVGNVFASVDQPKAGTTVTYYVNANDNGAITGCNLYIDGVDRGAMSLQQSGSYALQYYWPTSGSDSQHSAYALCGDTGGNSKASPGIKYFYVWATSDTSAPSVGSVSPTYTGANMATTFSASYSDTAGVTQCRLYDGSSLLWTSAATNPVQSGTASVTLSLGAGVHSLYMQCRDAVGNWGNGPTTSVTVGSGSSSDTQSPTVGMIYPTSAAKLQLYSATYGDNVGVSECRIMVDNDQNKNWQANLNNGTLSLQIDLTPGNHQLRASCRDYVGNWGYGSVTTVYVSPTIPTSGSCQYASGRLVKLPDDGNPWTTEDSVVYYYGTDCKRHAFPNERVFFSWYSNFGSVNTVSAYEMANMPLGKNVTYRPGVKMVKFTTLPKVYVVGKGGVLRWITSESLANSFYGAWWNQQIDDIPDAFYLNYTFGSDVYNVSDFSPSSEMSNAPTIDYSL